jgi:hypothetical protein
MRGPTSVRRRDSLQALTGMTRSRARTSNEALVARQQGGAPVPPWRGRTASLASVVDRAPSSSRPSGGLARDAVALRAAPARPKAAIQAPSETTLAEVSALTEEPPASRGGAVGRRRSSCRCRHRVWLRKEGSSPPRVDAQHRRQRRGRRRAAIPCRPPSVVVPSGVVSPVVPASALRR